jgi:YVTN family beta-propeller protein
MLLALSASGAPAAAGTLVVANKAEATVSLLDLPGGEVRATLPTGQGPHEVAVSPSGRRALVTNYGTRSAPGSSLTLIDLTKPAVERTIDLAPYRRPHGAVFLDEGRALVTVEQDRAVIEVDLEQGKVLRAVETGQEVSHMVAVPAAGKRAFVANIGSGGITVLDLEAGRKVQDVATGEGAEGLAVSADGKEVWVTNRGADTVTLVDGLSLRTLATLESPSFPIRAELTPDGKRLLVTNARSGDLAVFDTGSRQLVRRVPLALEGPETQTEGRLFGDQFGASSVPIGIEVAPDGKVAYIAHANADVIQVLDLERWETVGQLKAGKEPDGMGYSPLQVPAPGR